jgi:hypothetical protein
MAQELGERSNICFVFVSVMDRRPKLFNRKAGVASDKVPCRKVLIALHVVEFDGVEQVTVLTTAAAIALGEVVYAKMFSTLVASVRPEKNT